LTTVRRDTTSHTTTDVSTVGDHVTTHIQAVTESSKGGDKEYVEHILMIAFGATTVALVFGIVIHVTRVQCVKRRTPESEVDNYVHTRSVDIDKTPAVYDTINIPTYENITE
ncbi:hypothetical protein NP493_1915g00014, partial [Ridgeia piscesae]